VYNELMETSQLHTLFLIIHLFGVAIGAGGAFTSDGIFFASLRDKKISKDEFGIMKYSSQMTWLGLILLIISGVGLFGMNPEYLSQSAKFLLKMTIVGTLLLNGIVFHLAHLPFIGKHVGELLVKKNKPNDLEDTPYLLFSGVVSLTSWVLAIILGALGGIPVSYLLGLALYIGLIGLGTIISSLLFSKFLSSKNIKITFRIGIASVGLALLVLVMAHIQPYLM
jgi:uncharacterized membrane protein